MVRKPRTWSSSCRPGQAAGWDSSGGQLPRSAPPDDSACVSLMASPGKNRAQVLSRTEGTPVSAQARQPPLVASAKSSGKTSFEELGRWPPAPRGLERAIAVSSNTSVCTWLPPKLRNRGRRAARQPAAGWLSPAMKSRSHRAPALPGSSPARTPANNAGRVAGRHGVDDTDEDHRSYRQERRSHSESASGLCGSS